MPSTVQPNWPSRNDLSSRRFTQPVPPAGRTTRWARRYRRLPLWGQIALPVTAVSLLVGIGSGSSDTPDAQAAPTTSAPAPKRERQQTPVGVAAVATAPATAPLTTEPTTTTSTTTTTTVAPTTTMPAAPTDVTVTPYADSLVVSWTAGTGIAREIEVIDMSSGVSSFTQVVAEPPVIVTGRYANSYEVHVRVAGDAPSEWASSVAETPPAPTTTTVAPTTTVVFVPQPIAEIPSSDPRYDTCKEAKAHGANTPYREGVDPEYNWYRDADSDGLVCE